LGLLPIIVDEETHFQLMSLIEEEPDTQLSIDLENQTLTLPDGRQVTFPIDHFSKTCILNGVDQLGYLQSHASTIEAYETNHAAPVNTLG
jgi:3-isopropylmalate/(R)-2-methylmalate dehydratase small subunit